MHYHVATPLSSAPSSTLLQLQHHRHTAFLLPVQPPLPSTSLSSSSHPSHSRSCCPSNFHTSSSSSFTSSGGLHDRSSVFVVAKRARAPLLRPSSTGRSIIIASPPRCTLAAPPPPSPSPPSPSPSSSPASTKNRMGNPVALSSSSSTAKTGARKPKAAPTLTADGDSLQTTPTQVVLVLSHFGLCFYLLSQTLLTPLLQLQPQQNIDQLSSIVTWLLTITAAYELTDLLVGIYHHAVDNYGSGSTPLVGYQIAAFQGHHDYPWTITNRGFHNNLYRLTKPLLPQLTFLSLLLHSPSFDNYGYVTLHTAILLFIAVSQETHRQAHMVRPAGWARRLQQWGVIVSQQDHAAHHRGAFDDHYCILSGHWNGVLDRVRFFRALEGVVYVMCGTEPLCWGRDAGLKRESLDMVARVGLRRRERNSGRKEEEC